MSGDTIVLIVGLFFLLDFLIIILVLWIFFRAMKKLVDNSDFPEIANRWPAIIKPVGKEFNRQYVALNAIWYKNCANIIIADEGLYISLGFPVSLSSDTSTLIPWKYLSYHQKSRSFWSEVHEYQINLEPPITLTVMARVARSFPEQIRPVP